jgi:LacI family transcriptional regulator
VSNTRSITIVDVAKMAGISPSTVSRVINRRGYISEDTILKVEEAIQVLGYRPHWAARGLKGLPTKLVGLIIPDLSNVFYTGVAMSVAEVLNELEYEMILCVSDENPDKDLGYLNILEEKCVDGIIYAHPAHGSNSETLRCMVARGMPVVEINRQREVDLLDAVLADNLRGAQQGIDYLLAQGHRRIALITGSSTTTTGAERILGYQTSMARIGLQVDNDMLKVGEFSREWGEQATKELLALSNPPTAIFATSNRISLGTLKVLNELRIRIPDDMSIVSFDDPEWLAAWNPPITAVDIANDEMAKLAVQLLQRRMTGSVQKPVTYHLGTTLVIRKSCKKVA